MKLKLKLISSLTKVMPNATTPQERSFDTATALQDEVFSFQVAYYAEKHYTGINYHLSSPLDAYITLRQTGLVPAQLLNWDFDDNIITKSPGYFPDPLLAMPEKLTAFPYQWRSIWVTVRIPADCARGTYPIVITFSQETEQINEQLAFRLQVIPVRLPAQQISHSEWFYADCLSVIYHTPVWSERHWELLEKYFRNMTEHGITQILTPLFTPPLDTAIGGERTTTQLVDVIYENGKFSFSFDRLEKWIALAHQCGLKTFEFSHLYTQWGAKHAPKIMVSNNGMEEKMFGWHTDALSEQYQDFLSVFLAELVTFIDRLKIREQCCFHISDEPSLDALENYRIAGAVINRQLKGFRIIDAMSHIEFYNNGLCFHPIPSIGVLEEFVKANIPDLWTYYCCGPTTVTTNRFLHYPGARTRILGFQLYKYDIKGFLHWGYNFWFTRLSVDVIDPFTCPDAGAQFPAGDAFLVYPGKDGPVDALRYELIREAFQDQRAMQLLETYIGRDAAIEFMENVAGGPLTIASYPSTSEAVFDLRQAINHRIDQVI